MYAWVFCIFTRAWMCISRCRGSITIIYLSISSLVVYLFNNNLSSSSSPFSIVCSTLVGLHVWSEPDLEIINSRAMEAGEMSDSWCFTGTSLLYFLVPNFFFFQEALLLSSLGIVSCQGLKVGWSRPLVIFSNGLSTFSWTFQVTPSFLWIDNRWNLTQ